MQAVVSLYGGQKTAKDDFLSAVPNLPAGALRALAVAFQYLKGLGLEVWNEGGLSLRPLSEPGHMGVLFLRACALCTRVFRSCWRLTAVKLLAEPQLS